MLANEKPNSNAKGSFGFDRDRIERRLLTLNLEGGIEILRDAFHTDGSYGRDPSVFDPLKHLLCRTRTRSEAAVYRLVVVAYLEGKLITHATHGIDLLLPAANRGQWNPYAVTPRGSRTLAKGHFELGVFRDGAYRRGGRAFERLQWMVLIACHWQMLRAFERYPCSSHTQIGSHATLVVLGDDRPFEFVALVEEGHFESEAKIVEDF